MTIRNELVGCAVPGHTAARPRPRTPYWGASGQRSRGRGRAQVGVAIDKVELLQQGRLGGRFMLMNLLQTPVGRSASAPTAAEAATASPMLVPVRFASTANANDDSNSDSKTKRRIRGSQRSRLATRAPMSSYARPARPDRMPRTDDPVAVRRQRARAVPKTPCRPPRLCALRALVALVPFVSFVSFYPS